MVVLQDSRKQISVRMLTLLIAREWLNTGIIAVDLRGQLSRKILRSAAALPKDKNEDAGAES